MQMDDVQEFVFFTCPDFDNVIWQMLSLFVLLLSIEFHGAVPLADDFVYLFTIVW